MAGTLNTRELLVAGAREFGFELDSDVVQRFEIYLEELLHWNQKHNLTAIREPAQVVARHFVDAFSCTKAYDFNVRRPVIDVGTGAGFPGLPLKLLFPDLTLALVDSSIKKLDFLQHLCDRLELRDVDVVHARAEELGHSGAYRQRFHLVLARGVAAMPVLSELCLPFATVGGYFIAQKSLDARDEVLQAAAAIELLGGGAPELLEVNVPGVEATRLLVRVRKEDSTPSTYPRKTGVPAKQPLTGRARPARKRRKYD